VPAVVCAGARPFPRKEDFSQPRTFLLTAGHVDDFDLERLCVFGKYRTLEYMNSFARFGALSKNRKIAKYRKES
jgi:hypothetical protein